MISSKPEMTDINPCPDADVVSGRSSGHSRPDMFFVKNVRTQHLYI